MTGGRILLVPPDHASLRPAAIVHSVSWRESHRAFCSPAFIELHTPERQEAYLRGKISRGGALYMLVDGGPVGIVCVTGSVIEDLYVLPERQNRGYGTRLLRHAIDRCTGTPTLWILENNVDAERLYRRMGFRETGRRNGVAEGLDEIEFALAAP